MNRERQGKLFHEKSFSPETLLLRTKRIHPMHTHNKSALQTFLHEKLFSKK